MGKDEYIRFRCDPDLKTRFERVAALMRRNSSDLGRIVFEDYVAEQERQLGLTGFTLKESAPDYRANSSKASLTPKQKQFVEIVRRGDKARKK